MVAISQVDGPASYINRAGRELLGIGPNEVVSCSTTGPPGADPHPRAGDPDGGGAGVWTGETAFRSRAGREIPCSQVLLAHKHEDGSVAFLSAVARDITERQLRRSRAARSEDQFRGAFEDTDVAMVLTDLQHRFIRVNAAFAHLFGYSRSEMLELAMADITHPDDISASLASGPRC